MKKIFQRLAILSLSLVIMMVLTGSAASMISVYGADSSALQALVSETEQMDVSGYTDESAALLQSALNSARQVIQDESASSIRINNYITMLHAVIQTLVKKADTNIPACGKYTIKGILRQASSDSGSMGNESIAQPMELIVGDDGMTLRLHFSSLTVPGLGQGYLSNLSYLPDWDGTFLEMTDEQYQAFRACVIEEYYEGVYDVFNDPDTGKDLAVKGHLYPKYLTMPVAYRDAEVWVRVYIPIMESISAGGGTQYARLQMDWDTLTWIAPNKGDLDVAVQQLAQMKGVVLAADYTQEMVDLLEQAVIAGNYVQNSANIGQTQVDDMAQALNTVANLFADAEKQYLHDMIQLAHNYITEDYADTYVADMKERIRTAQEVYNNAFATQTQVNEQYALLLQAISNARKKETAEDTPTPAPTPAPTPTPTSVTPGGGSTEGKDKELDKDKLKDGVYAVTGRMVKVDKRTVSMSNDAINHVIKLTVEKGKYRITMDFMGLNINGSYGYLSKLKYYKKGYTLDSYGMPQGTAKAVTVESYQLDKSGARVSDTYGTDYPNQVTFPLIPEAVEDGYVPLQVHIPIMEAVSAGTGTQPVFLFLDWDTLKSTTENEEDFKDKQSESQGNTDTAGNVFTANAPLFKGNASLTGTGSALNRSITGSLSGSNKPGLSGAGIEATEMEGFLAETMMAETMPVETAAAEIQPDHSSTVSSDSSTDMPGREAVPTVMSILVAGAGFLFKLKSRGGL